MPPPPRRPAKVVGIHGIGHTYLTGPQLRTVWLEALQGGLEEAAAEAIEPVDFAVVAYGALFRRPPMRGGDQASGVNEWEQGLLVEWWKEAARLSQESRRKDSPNGEDPTIQGPDFEGRFYTPAVAQHALRQLAKSRFFNAIGPDRILVFALAQVRAFLFDESIKSATLDRVCRFVGRGTQVLIGHSLGSIVAYEALCAHPEWGVKAFITVGSPLGIPNLIFDALTPRPTGGKGRWPNVERWFNIADPGDIVALEKRLGPYFGAVEDSTSSNGWRSHDAVRYLNSAEAGRCVAAALRR
jgi:hypothetical protein